MAKVRVSTTVDETLLAAAREAHGGGTDASLVEAALTELLRTHRRAEIDAAYTAAYRDQPVDLPDEWGDLAEWHEAASTARSRDTTRGRPTHDARDLLRPDSR